MADLKYASKHNMDGMPLILLMLCDKMIKEMTVNPQNQLSQKQRNDILDLVFFTLLWIFCVQLSSLIKIWHTFKQYLFSLTYFLRFTDLGLI